MIMFRKCVPLVLWTFILIYGFGLFYVSCNKRNEFRIAWMAPKKEYYNLSASSSVSALKVALTAMGQNSDTNQIQSLQNSTIKVRWYDTDCNAKSALAAAVDAKSKFDPHLFLGPPCSAGMRGVALLASHWNTPIFGWVSQEEEFQDKKMYSTLVRFLGPLNRIPGVMFHMTSIFKWNQFAVMYDERDPYRAVASAISEKKSIENDEDETKNWYSIIRSFKVSNDMEEKEIEDMFTQLKRYSRIIVMALPWLDMRRYMLVAHRLGMTNGEYAFLCIHGDLYTYDRMETDVFSDKVWRRNDSFDEIAKEAFEPVLHIMMKPLEKNQWTLFKNVADEYGDRTNQNWNLPIEHTSPDAYSPYLYDATLMWAMLADKILKQNKNPHDGENMFKMAATLTEKEELDGLTGRVNLDDKGDRNLDFQVLDMSENGTFTRIITINYLGKGIREVNFEGSETTDQVSRWPNGKVGIKNAPSDEPRCGFTGEKCPVADKQPERVYIIVLSILGVLLVISIIINVFCILKICAKPGTYNLNPATTIRYQNMPRKETTNPVPY